MACGPCGDALRWQGELRRISIFPFAPLIPTPLKTSRDTLHPGTGERPGLLPCGARPGDGVTGFVA